MTTTIEWTDETWNPTVGCSRVSPGCDNCYAIRVASREMQPAHRGLAITRFDREPDGRPINERLDWTGEVRCLPERLDAPLHWRKPRRVFVDSMSDLFHPDVPIDFIAKVFAVMAIAEAHTFQVLTKRPQRMATLLTDQGGASTDELMGFVATRNAYIADLAGPEVAARHGYVWPSPNVWLGASVENQQYADLRIPYLKRTPAAVRFLSIEPLLGPVELFDHLFGIDWVIVGGESGPGARPVHPDWPRSIRDLCIERTVPFFFKQWGEWSPDRVRAPQAGRIDGHGHYCADGRWITVSEDKDSAVWLARNGKKLSGRELDGRTWDEMPERAA